MNLPLRAVSGLAALIACASAAAQILPPPLVSVRAVDVEAREMPPLLPAIDSARFRLERTGDPAGVLWVLVSTAGTALPGRDYRELGSMIWFAAGEHAVEVEVVPIDDELLEGDETVVLQIEPDPTLGPIEHYRVDRALSAAKAVIHDNDILTGPPTLNITAPASGAVFPIGTTIRIAAVAVDPAGFIAHVDFLADGVKIGDSSLAWPACVGCEPKPGDPARHVFEWKSAPAGRHELTVRATHRLVFQPRFIEEPLVPPLVSAPVGVAVLDSPPSSRLSIAATQPVAEESSYPYRRLPLVGEFTVSREGDLSQAASVFVHYGGSAVNGKDCEPLPWLVTIPAGERSVAVPVKAIPDSLAEGTETLLARLALCPPQTDPPLGIPCVGVAIDPSRSEATVTICDDARCGQMARIEITAPLEGARFPVGAAIGIGAVAIDPLGAITALEFWAGDKKIGDSVIFFFRAPDPGTPIHHDFAWKDAPAGRHVLTARGLDSFGATVVSQPVTVTVGEVQDLRAAILKPLGGSVFAVGEPVAIEAVAAGPVARLEVLVDGIVLASKPEAALKVEWTASPAGTHLLAARATDSAGRQAASPPVRVLVRELAPSSFVRRVLPAGYVPGQPFGVSLVAEPPRAASAWAVADRPPAHWTVDQVSSDGVFDAVNGLVKFGPFADLQPRTLTYRVTPPVTAQGRQEFAGEAALGGVVIPIGGDRVISPAAESHPADIRPRDFALGMAEVTAYAAAWVEGATWPSGPVPIPLSYVTRAGFLWKSGEKYAFAPDRGLPPECWVPVAGAGGPGIAGGSPPAAVRVLSGAAAPGIPVEVNIQVVPGSTAAAFAIEESIPEGWTFDKAESGGRFDAIRRQLRWGPFYAAQPMTLAYRVVPPTGVASLAALRGWASFDGRDQPIQGARMALAEDAATAVRFGRVVPDATGVQLEVTGTPGQLVQVEASADLVQWVPHRTAFVLENGKVRVDDAPATGPARFFRLRPVAGP